jgi:putative transposase
MYAIFYHLRTGCQWKALDATGICSSNSAHQLFQELWAQDLFDYDELKGLD